MYKHKAYTRKKKKKNKKTKKDKIYTNKHVRYILSLKAKKAKNKK